MEKSPAVVPCATADEESGSSLKLGPCVDQPFVLLGTRKLVLEMLLSNEPLHKISLSAEVNLNLILELPCALYSVYSPSVGVVRLAEYVCTHPSFNIYRGRPRLRSRRRRVGYRPAPSLACGFGSPAGDTAWRKTLMTPFYN